MLDFEEDSWDEENVDSGIARSSQDNIVDGHYKIDTSKTITELSNDFCKYYLANDIEKGDEYFAIVFEHVFDYNFDILESLKFNELRNIIKPIAYSITKLTPMNSEHIVVIIPKYDFTQTLTSYIQQNGSISSSEIVEKLIIPFVSILEFFDKYNYPIGNICPNNIIVYDNQFFLKEPFIYPAHSCQKSEFLPSEIFDCIPWGRFSPSIKADCYALGVSVYFAVSGQTSWNKYSNDDYKLLRLEQTTYSILFGKLKLMNDLKSLLKGILNDRPSDRWDVKHIQDWISGKASKAVRESQDAIAPVGFGEHSVYNCASLAHLMHHNWETALSFIKQDRLLKWLQRSVSKSKVNDVLHEIVEDVKMKVNVFNHDINNTLFMVISALNPDLTIRYRNFCCTVESIPKILLYSSFFQKKDILEKTLAIIGKKFWESWYEISLDPEKLRQQILPVESGFKMYNPSIMIFAAERLVYALNPKVPCLSTNLGGCYIRSIKELLAAQNKLIESNENVPLIDRHIVAYIANYTELKQDIKVKSLNPYPKIASNIAMNALSIILIAKQHAPNIKIPNITRVLSQRIVELVKANFHSVTNKKNMIANIDKAGQEGDINGMYNAITNIGTIQNDYQGYNKAVTEVNKIKRKIASLQNEQKVNDIGFFFGERIVVLLSYGLFSIVIFVLLF